MRALILTGPESEGQRAVDRALKQAFSERGDFCLSLSARVLLGQHPARSMLRALEDEGALLARMSGSGATCFGIFDSARAAGLAAYRIGASYEDWWITATGLAPAPVAG